ncbi:hypothetical protein DFH28DRAFT_1132617 [Melampsora americana]|nr:hypothetical protein DFH28DRAFT_1132617 [Melampsora americana]
MTSTLSSSQSNVTRCSTPRTSEPRNSGSCEITWLGTTYNTGFTPGGYLRWRARRLLTPDQSSNPSSSPTPGIDLSPRALRAQRREANMNKGVRHLSPRAQRELHRLEQYQLKQKSKQEMRRIIKVIQSKRRVEFLVLREALGELVRYDGPYLQAPGEKECAAHILRMGGLGHEFVHVFDNEAKWAWLDIRVKNF